MIESAIAGIFAYTLIKAEIKTSKKE